MTIDQLLGALLILALLFRYHRNELRKAEERFDKCDKERVLLHNLYYQRFGADFSSGGAVPDEPIEREPETAEARLKERIQRKKLELKRLARTRPEHLGRALRNIEQQGRPRLTQIRPALDPETAKVAAQQASDLFEQAKQQVNNGRPTRTGG